MYKITTTPTGNTLIILETASLFSAIPADETNVEYQQYLAWLAKGNTPEEWTN